MKAVTINEMEEAVIIVFNECGSNLPLKFVIRETAEEHYGQEAIRLHPELKTAQAAYFPKRQIVAFTCSRILYDNSSGGSNESCYGRDQGIKTAVKVARHEILGHYGLNTCSAEQKLNILEAIIKHQSDPKLQKVWDNAKKNYPELSSIAQAEEVFAFIAEDNPKLDVGFSLEIEPFTINHVEQISARITGIRLGERTQQIFPKTNQAQFYQSSYFWSKPDTKMIVYINAEIPSKINSETLEKIAAKDKFLRNYSIEAIKSGKLDLSFAKGIQPVPKTYDGQGRQILDQELPKALKLN